MSQPVELHNGKQQSRPGKVQIKSGKSHYHEPVIKNVRERPLSGNDFKRYIEGTDYQYAIKNRDSLFNKCRMFLKHKKSDHTWSY
jgi:hypothetical protein